MLNWTQYTLNGKKVGKLLNDFAYVTDRRQSKHLFRGGKKDVRSAKAAGTASWGISSDIIEDLERRGVRVLVVVERESEVNYWVPLSEFRSGAQFRTFVGDTQLFLGLAKWRNTKDYGRLMDVLSELSYRRRAA